MSGYRAWLHIRLLFGWHLFVGRYRAGYFHIDLIRKRREGGP